MSDKKYIEGFFVNAPKDTAPDYVITKVNLDVHRFITWLENNTDDEGRVYIDILSSQAGKHYGKINEWRPNASK